MTNPIKNMNTKDLQGVIDDLFDQIDELQTKLSSQEATYRSSIVADMLRMCIPTESILEDAPKLCDFISNGKPEPKPFFSSVKAVKDLNKAMTLIKKKSAPKKRGLKRKYTKRSKFWKKK